jgi:hypothetical protein
MRMICYLITLLYPNTIEKYKSKIMKKFTQTQLKCTHCYVAIFKETKFLKLLIAIILLSSPLLIAAKLPASNSSAIKVLKTYSPLASTESLRTNLYLLQPDNTTILADGVYTEYNNLYHDSVTLEDAGKMTNFLENLGLLRYGNTLAVERRPIIKANDTLYYKLWKTTKRNYQFELITSLVTNIGLQAFFIDSYLNTSTQLPLAGTIKINFAINTDAASAATDRFKVIFKPLIVSFAPLPVTFTSVKAYRQAANVAVDWKVENEISIVKYEVEKSFNGKDYAVVNTVPVNALSNVSGNYLWVDNSQSAGDVFYRVKSIGINNNVKYTSILSVKGIHSAASINVYPNPVVGNVINLQITNKATGIYQVKLINNAGQIVYSNKIVVGSSNMSQALHVGSSVLKGIYQLEVKSADNLTTVKTLMLQ